MKQINSAAAIIYKRANIVWMVLLLGMVVIVLLPSSPLLYHLPDTDSSIFLTIGQKIRLGQFPYRDWYDHKPPLIFYLNALGLTLGNGSRWGVWAIELVSLSSAVLFGFRFLRRYFNGFIAALALGASLIHLSFMLERGNLTEEYSLPFQFASIFLLGGLERSRKPGWRLFGIGCMLAMASSLKQTMAGIGLSIAVYLAVVYLLRNDWRRLLVAYLQVALGVLFVWSAWFIYFALAGIFADFWEAAFLYNFALSGIPLGKRLLALASAFGKWSGNSTYFLVGMLIWLVSLYALFTEENRLLAFLSSRWMKIALAALGGLAILKGVSGLRGGLTVETAAWIIAGLVIGLVAILLYQKAASRFDAILKAREEERKTASFLPLMIAAVDLPVAFLLSSLSGNNYNHYYMALLPSLSILTAYAISVIARGFQPRLGKAMASVWSAVFIIALVTPGIQRTSDEYAIKTDRQVIDAINYVNSNTAPGDYVYQWGDMPAINMVTGRESPSRFFFADPLFVVGYSGSMQSEILLRELQAHPPVLIINTKIPRLPFITTKDPSQCDRVKDKNYYYQTVSQWTTNPAEIVDRPEGMEGVYYWICQNYVYQTSLGELKWDVYRLKGK